MYYMSDSISLNFEEYCQRFNNDPEFRAAELREASENLEKLCSLQLDQCDDEEPDDLEQTVQEIHELLNINEEENKMNTVDPKIVTTTHMPNVADMLSTYATSTIEHYISIMPNGRFLNGHNQKIEECDGIVMLASGEVCPIFHNTICCLNPLKTERHEDCPYLSTWSVAGNIIPDATSIHKTVGRYNRELHSTTKAYSLTSFGSKAIIAYHSFKPGW